MGRNRVRDKETEKKEVDKWLAGDKKARDWTIEFKKRDALHGQPHGNLKLNSRDLLLQQSHLAGVRLDSLVESYKKKFGTSSDEKIQHSDNKEKNSIINMLNEYASIMKPFASEVQQSILDIEATLLACQRLNELAVFLKSSCGEASDGTIKNSRHNTANKVVELLNEYLQMTSPHTPDQKRRIVEIEAEINELMYDAGEKIRKEPPTGQIQRKLSELRNPEGTTRACLDAWIKIQDNPNLGDAKWRIPIFEKRQADKKASDNAPKNN